jgi:bacterioferritin-associated ferredoxin
VRLVGWKVTLKELAPQDGAGSNCGKKVAEVVAVARPRPRGVP